MTEMEPNAPYVHGYGDAEMQRLTRMQTLVNDAELAVLDLTGVRTVLDVGAGLGQMTRAIAHRLGPGSRVLGIERDPRQRAEAERQAAAAGEADLVELRAGDATALPLSEAERGSFDLAHARFVLEHVPDPEAVVCEMVSAVKPGGRLVLMDDDHELLRLWPEPAAVQHAWEVYWRSYALHGHDPLVGRRLGALLTAAGARVTRVTTVFYGACHGMPQFDAVVDNLAGVLRGAAGGLAETGQLEASAMDTALAELQGWRAANDATVWYSLPLAEGVRR